jgi:hypothetical protein
MGIDLSKANEKFKARIQEIPTNYRPLAGVQSKVSKSDSGRKEQDRQLEEGQRRCGFRIQLICVRRRLLDTHDNLPAALKPAVDRICFRLGFDYDSDPLLQWSYGQTRTMGREGLVIIIEPYEPKYKNQT